jgi:hypothetical protein
MGKLRTDRRVPQSPSGQPCPEHATRGAEELAKLLVIIKVCLKFSRRNTARIRTCNEDCLPACAKENFAAGARFAESSSRTPDDRNTAVRTPGRHFELGAQIPVPSASSSNLASPGNHVPIRRTATSRHCSGTVVCPAAITSRNGRAHGVCWAERPCRCTTGNRIAM